VLHAQVRQRVDHRVRDRERRAHRRRLAHAFRAERMVRQRRDGPLDLAMLRNVAETAPYFHDGSVDRLDRAVWIMATVQLGRALADDTVASIVSFLESLTGEIPKNYAPPGQRPEF
jgi:cytochrome c peroxidase